MAREVLPWPGCPAISRTSPATAPRMMSSRGANREGTKTSGSAFSKSSRAPSPRRSSGVGSVVGVVVFFAIAGLLEYLEPVAQPLVGPLVLRLTPPPTLPNVVGHLLILPAHHPSPLPRLPRSR